jgi:hypothetical protein
MIWIMSMNTMEIDDDNTDDDDADDNADRHDD